MTGQGNDVSLIHFIHTPLFDESAESVPLTDADLRAVQNTLRADPETGDLIRGAGGARKLRAAVKGFGKRGGARVIYYYAGRDGTIYLLLAYSKDESDSLTAAGKVALRTLIK